MKRTTFVVSALIATFGLMPFDRLAAQPFTILHSFTSSPGDGADPQAGLVQAGNRLYGTTPAGGSNGFGTVFAVNTDGSGYTNLHSFGLGGDGIQPRASLALAGDTLYGTAAGGGSSSGGTLFRINTNGTGYTNFYHFTVASGGVNPYGSLIVAGNTLYGTTFNPYGSVFAINTNGSGFTNLHSFPATVDGTNSDGTYPQAGLVLSGNTLYGTASQGGSYTRGTVFALNTNSTGFTNLHSFTYSDGANPDAAVILSGGTLYGTTAVGGFSGQGVVFALNTNGTGFTNLRSFSGGLGGAYPEGGVTLVGDTLFGTASAGGTAAYGTIFMLKTNGTGFTNLYHFTLSSSDGSQPYAKLLLSGNTLFSTTYRGGSASAGTVFSFKLPQLSILRSGANAILAWPAYFTGHSLQSAPASTGTFTNLPGATSPYTNPISGAQQFFRLMSN